MLPNQPSQLLAVWVHTTDRTRVYVYPEFKRRLVYSHPSNSAPNGDEWPILYRRDVPALTDAEWIACPGEGWVAA